MRLARGKPPELRDQALALCEENRYEGLDQSVWADYQPSDSGRGCKPDNRAWRINSYSWFG